jgi:ABC-type antimicrobial peptide transport system permease subunit
MRYSNQVQICRSCLGVYGLIAFTTSRRTHEVDVRKAMGAGFTRISFLFVKEFLFLTLIIAILAMFYHTYRASTLQPAESLQYE